MGTVNKREKCLGFVRSEVQAKKMMTKLKVLDNIMDLEYDLQEIGKGKQGLINWLNGFTLKNDEVKDILKQVMGV